MTAHNKRIESALRGPDSFAALGIMNRAQQEYIRSAEAEKDSNAGSVFLRLLASREQKDPGSVKAIYPELCEAVRFVAENQDYFDASPDIYGSFNELGAKVDHLCA